MYSVSSNYPGLPGLSGLYMVDGPVSEAGWSQWYRVRLYSHDGTGRPVWDIRNHQGRYVKASGRLGKQIIAAIEAHQQKGS